MLEPSLAECARQATRIARDAGAILRDRFDKPHDVHFKGPLDMVTEADRASEALIASRLRSIFPDHDLLGEEGSRGESTNSPFRWVIDPLDGTTNFTHGLPTFAVSIGLERDGVSVVGVVYDPMRDELFTAIENGGAHLNGKPLHVSPTETLFGSLLVTGFSYHLEKRALQAATWREFLTRVQAIRQTGSAALNLCYIAAGRLDGYWEDGIAPWDVSAGAVIVKEAGGLVTNLAGGAFQSGNRQIIASNGIIHSELVNVIAGRPG